MPLFSNYATRSKTCQTSHLGGQASFGGQASSRRLAVNPVPTLYPPTSRDIARRRQMQLCMIACSLVRIACAIDPSAAGALRGDFSQECCLGAPEAAHPLLAGSRLYSACEPNGWASFNLLALAPDHLNRDGWGNKEVIQPSNCQMVAQRCRNSARCHCQSLASAYFERTHQLREGEAQPLPRCPATASAYVYPVYHAHAVVFPLQLTAGGLGAHLRRG